MPAEGDTVQPDGGEVVDRVRERLVDAGFDKAAAIPDTDRTITLFQAEELGRAQDAMRLLDVLDTWLPVLTVVLAALAVWTPGTPRDGGGHRDGCRRDDGAAARRAGRRQAGLPGLGPAPGTARRGGRGDLRHVRPVPARQHAHRAGRRGAHGTVAYLYGPGRPARAVRRASRAGTTAAGRALRRAGVRTGSTGNWLADHRAWTTGGVFAAGALALVLWNHPTVAAVALVLGVALAVPVVLAVAVPHGRGESGP